MYKFIDIYKEKVHENTLYFFENIYETAKKAILFSENRTFEIRTLSTTNKRNKTQEKTDFYFICMESASLNSFPALNFGALIAEILRRACALGLCPW